MEQLPLTSKRFRATVWHLSGVADCVDGYAGVHRYITEEDAESPSQFEAIIRDRYLSDQDADVSFGPISDVTEPRDHWYDSWR